MKAAELKILRWAWGGVTLKEMVGNEYTWGTAKIRIEEKLREERLMWFGHVKRREESYIGRRVMTCQERGKRKATEVVEW